MLLLAAILITGGWSSMSIEPKTNNIFDKIDEINMSIRQLDWERVNEEADTLKVLYAKEKWKLQLLGDEREYEQVENEIFRFKEAAEEKDKSQSKIILSSIRTTLKNIYSL
jgi:hypothetical protein